MLTIILLSVGFAITSTLLVLIANVQERFNEDPLKAGEVVQIILFLVIPMFGCMIGLIYLTGLWAFPILFGSFLVGILSVEGARRLYKAL